jgi:hypothetical protein
MNSRNTQHATREPDPELTAQENPPVLAWLLFHIVAAWSSASYWLRFRRVCAWHQPKPRRMGGNPFARNVTHGLCPQCFARVSAEIISGAQTISHGETQPHVSVVSAAHADEPSLLAPPARNCAVPARLQRPSTGDPDTARPALLRGKII